MNIPDGWREVQPYEVVLEGDMFSNIEDGFDWAKCYHSVGVIMSEAFTTGMYTVIRKLPVQQPQEDKEWRNPWD